MMTTISSLITIIFYKFNLYKSRNSENSNFTCLKNNILKTKIFRKMAGNDSQKMHNFIKKLADYQKCAKR